MYVHNKGIVTNYGSIFFYSPVPHVHTMYLL